MKAVDPLFFIAIIPPDEIADAIRIYKEDMALRFHSKAALKSPVHITLHMPFRYPEKKLDNLEQLLTEFSADFAEFDIQLKNFGSFPPRVIFVNVQENNCLEALQNELLKQMRKNLNIFNGNYKERVFHPHITIAFRDLKPREFKIAWEEYKNQSLLFDFSATKISLLKHDGNSWQVHKDFELKKPTPQPSL